MAKKSEMIGFKTTPEIKAALEDIAEREDRTVSYIINRILEQHLILNQSITAQDLIGNKPVITAKPAKEEKNIG